jgi:hypothetical protein
MVVHSLPESGRMSVRGYQLASTASGRPSEPQDRTAQRVKRKGSLPPLWPSTGFLRGSDNRSQPAGGSVMTQKKSSGGGVWPAWLSML